MFGPRRLCRHRCCCCSVNRLTFDGNQWIIWCALRKCIVRMSFITFNQSIILLNRHVNGIKWIFVLFFSSFHFIIFFSPKITRVKMMICLLMQLKWYAQMFAFRLSCFLIRFRCLILIRRKFSLYAFKGWIFLQHRLSLMLLKRQKSKSFYATEND